MGNFKVIMCSGKSMNKLDRYLKVGKPIMMCPTMDYHKTLWTLALANNSLKEKNNQLDTLVYIKPKKKH